MTHCHTINNNKYARYEIIVRNVVMFFRYRYHYIITKFKNSIKMSQLTTDCLDEIFEYLEDDKFTLYSCLLVNRLWCKISVRILWRNIRDYNTLIACLPNESKEILYKNKIIFSTSTSKPPIFNYASFCKSISLSDVKYDIRKFL